MSRHTPSVFSVALLLLVGCKHDDRTAPRPSPNAKPALAHSSQRDLAGELEMAEHDGSWSEVRERWEGQTVQWTVTRQHALCRSAEWCNVQPFAVERPAKHGWLPQLTFAPSEFGKLDAACGAAEQCELTFAGTLSELQTSPEMPTNLHFTNATVIRAAAMQLATR